ncbi:hypothetical protein HS960_06810 [Sphingobacterium paramultivorum]|uniref:DUF4157 domain-containing protein n=1 Tax=Sphingobacterium paramultivorum TaxID=2886510 RepID=A0A7G5E059_9SPHI|nr:MULTISPECIES: hypothetical protein [Sphingobacterium]MCS4164547.1 hypothetical protein [Sphingobacterium sp. BIGb0116]QMV67384.1 hypothetical protein HS960_06810 [Sphingobacterium paramultivorum]WSO16247.1 hypothetical protein VUL84_06790 [Sphingobacterium paramultivorum]
MKKISITFLYLLLSALALGQESKETKPDSIVQYFSEIKTATKIGYSLWNRDLYDDIILVNPETRQLFSNNFGADSSFVQYKNSYIAKLPDSVNIANTSLTWNGRTWAMIMLPLSKDYYARINLLAHELFHSAQSALGFVQNNSESTHLDQENGRIYLRLELEALKKAVCSDAQDEQRMHLKDALIFRKYRNSLFPGSAHIENQLELNEGIAEYTGVMISGRDKEKTKKHFIDVIDRFFKNPTYVRSFAYNTTPIYGYIMSLKDPLWNQKISVNTDLTVFFMRELNIELPKDLAATVKAITAEYNGKQIFTEEQLRAEKIKKQIALYRSLFVDQPHMTIKFEKMNVSFDPRNILPITDLGTVYPTIRIADNWGILDVKSGALMAPNWDKITVSRPTKIEGQRIEGEGWVMQLKDQYTVQKDESLNNYKLIKKQ